MIYIFIAALSVSRSSQNWLWVNSDNIDEMRGYECMWFTVLLLVSDLFVMINSTVGRELIETILDPITFAMTRA